MPTFSYYSNNLGFLYYYINLHINYSFANKYSPRAPFYFQCFAFISQLLFVGTNINFFFLNRLIILQMQKQISEEAICGWGDQNDIHLDSIKLSNIIKRKSTIHVLPQLNATKTKMQTIYRQQFSNTRLANPKNLFFQLNKHQPKIVRKKTEPFEERDPFPAFRNQKIFKSDQQSPNTISPIQKDSQRLQSIKRITYNNEIVEKGSPNKKDEEESTKDTKYLPFFKLSQYRNNKSPDFLQRYHQDKSKSPQKTESKFYLKLSTLSNSNSPTKQLILKNPRKNGHQACMSEQRDLENKEKRKMHLEILNRINSKLSEAFTKNDVFLKNRKTALGGKLQGSSQMTSVFSQNSILLEKHSLHSKLKQLNRCGFDFK